MKEPRSAQEKQVLFVILICIGFILASASSFLPILLSGQKIADIQQDINLLNDSSSGVLRFTLFLNQFFLFLLPSLVYLIFIEGKNAFNFLRFQKLPSLYTIFLGILFLVVSYPLVNLVNYINSFIPLAEWMTTNEDQVAEMLQKIILTDAYSVMILNVCLIAILPAIAEELVFRGIAQNNFEKILNNGHMSVWLSALLFSLIHFQFEGFLARMVLGAVLGYSYYLTRNFWVPVFLHFLNNLIPLLALSMWEVDLTNMENSDISFNWFLLILPILGLPILYILYTKEDGKRNNNKT